MGMGLWESKISQKFGQICDFAMYRKRRGFSSECGSSSENGLKSGSQSRSESGSRSETGFKFGSRSESTCGLESESQSNLDSDPD